MSMDGWIPDRQMDRSMCIVYIQRQRYSQKAKGRRKSKKGGGNQLHLP